MSVNDTLVNGRSPVTKVSNGTTTKFPDVCKTPVGNAIVPIPYPNISKSGDLDKGSKSVKINGAPACLSSSEISTSTGDEAGSAKGIGSGTTKGKAYPMTYSFDVKIEGKHTVRNGDLFIGNNRNTPPLPIIQAQRDYTPMNGGATSNGEVKQNSHDLHFLVQDEVTGRPLANIPYKITLENGKSVEGITNEYGITEKINDNSASIATLEAPYYGNNTSSVNTGDEYSACGC